MIIPVFGAGNFHRDGDEFSSRGNFIYITMERNLPPDANEEYAKGRMRYAPTDMQADNCRANRIRPIYIGISVYNGCRA